MDGSGALGAVRRVRGKGIEVDLRKYTRVHNAAGTAFLWDPACQGPLMESSAGLDRFLARVSVDESQNVAFFSKSERGREVASRSRAAKLRRGLPPAEKAALTDCLKKLAQLASDEKTDPSFRRLAKGFKLPDPKDTPEMYRLYHDRPWYECLWRRPRLMVLWGCTRDGLAPVEPLQAVADIPVESLAWLRRGGLWLAVLLLLAVLVALASAFEKKYGRHSLPPPPRSGQYLKIITPSATTLWRPVTAMVSRPGTVSFGGRDATPLGRGESHTYSGFAKPGRYKVIWVPNNKTLNTESHAVLVRSSFGSASRKPGCGQPPQANLRLVPNHGVVGDSIRADSSASFAGTGREIVSREIRWSDGEKFVPLATPVSKHRFLADGLYNVTLRVTDNKGLTSEDTEPVAIGVAPPLAAPAAVIHVVSIDQAHRRITLQDASRGPGGGGDIGGSTVDWGDGSRPETMSGPGAAYTHAYKGSGPFIIKLSAADRANVKTREPAVYRVSFARKFQIVQSGREDMAGGRVEVTLVVRDAKNPNAVDYEVTGWRVDGGELEKAGSRDLTVVESKGKYAIQVDVQWKGASGVKITKTFTAPLMVGLERSQRVTETVDVGPTAEGDAP